MRDGERRLFEMESELESARGSVHKGKRRLWIVSVALLAILVAAIACGGKLFHRPPLFEDIVFVPADAPEEDTESRYSQKNLEEKLPAAWDMLHDIFDKLRKGHITGEAAADDVSKVAKKYNEDSEDALSELLNAAAERMKERYPEK